MKCPHCGAFNRSSAQVCVNCAGSVQVGPGGRGGTATPKVAAASTTPRPTGARSEPAPVRSAPAPAPAPAAPLPTPLPTPPPVPLDAATGGVISSLEPLPPAPAVDLGSSAGEGEAFGYDLDDSGRGDIRSLSSSVDPALGASQELRRRPRGDFAGEAEITQIQERRRLDRSRFADLADRQPRWSLLGRTPPLVGRAVELERLTQFWDEVCHAPRLLVALVSGPPGVGKNRLLDELAGRLALSQPAPRVFTTSVPEGASDLRSALLEPLLRARLGLAPGSSPGQAEERLAQELGRRVAPGELREQMALLAQTLGQALPDEARTWVPGDSESPERLAERAALRFLRQDAAERPLLWVVDNLDRAPDEALASLFPLCAQLADVPILLVGLSLPELRRRALPWTELQTPGGESLLRELSLRPLDEAQTRELLRAFLGTSELPAALHDLAFRKSAGNPLALEQVLELLHLHEVLQRQGEQWRFAEEHLRDGQIPVSLDDLVEARLQQLDATQLGVLRKAAVQGKVFWLGAIMACARLTRPAGAGELWFDETLEEEVRQVILGLQGRDILQFLGEGPFPGELRFEFRQGFEREWVYRHTPQEERGLYHRMVAQWLEQVSGSVGQPMYDAVARHLEAGGALRRAAFAYIKGGRLASRGYRNEEAVERLQRASGFLREDDAAARIDAHEELGRIYLSVGDFAQALESYLRMLRDGYLLGARERIAAAYAALGRVYTDQGAFAPGEKCLLRSLALYEELGDQQGVAAALDHVGQLYLRQGGSGSLDRAQTNFERSLKIRRDLSDELGTALSYHLLGWVYTDRGFTREGRLCFKEAIRLRSGAGDKDGLCRSLNNLAETYRLAGEIERARRDYAEALRVAEEIGARPLQSVVLGNLAECDLSEGHLDEARRQVEEALEISTGLGDQPMIVSHRIIQSKVLQAAGDGEGARHAAEEAMRLLEQLQGTEDLGPALRRLGEVLALSAGGATGEAQFRRARDCFRRSIRVLSEAGNDLELARSMEAYGDFLGERGHREKGDLYRQRAQEILARMRRVQG